MKKIQAKKRYRVIRLRRLRNRLEELLNILPLSGLYEIYETAGDERLQKKAEQKILETTTEKGALLELIKYSSEPLRSSAWNKLKSRIKQGQIIKDATKEILETIMESVSDLRKEAWELYKTLDPTDKELKKIQSLDFIYSTPSIAYDIEQLLKRKCKRKKPHTARTIKKILEITGKIAKLKRGQ